MKRTLLAVFTCTVFGVRAALARAEEPVRHKVLAQDKGHVVILNEKGEVEWEVALQAHVARHRPAAERQLPAAHQRHRPIVEMTPEKKVVWKYESKPKEGYKGGARSTPSSGSPNGNTMVAECGNAPHHRGRQGRQDRQGVAADGRATRTPTATRAWPASWTTATTSSATRATARSASTTTNGKVVWSYTLDLAGRPASPGHGPEGHGDHVYGAFRLPNGNTLIGGGNGNRVIEVTPTARSSGAIDQKELPGITLAWVTTLQVLPNGNVDHRQLPRRPGQPAAHRGDARQEGRLDVQGLQRPSATAPPPPRCWASRGT